MRIVVVGAGALGGLIGAQLSEAGEDVVLVEINKARVKLLTETGLFIAAGAQGERCVKIRVVSGVEDLPLADLVFLSVKSYQTGSAIQSVGAVIGPETRVLSMQNGIGNTEVLAELLGEERVLCGITYHSIQHTGPNRIRYRVGIKPIQIAPYRGEVTPEVEAIGEIFNRAGLPTNVVANIDHAVWQKLLHNAVVNPVSALTGLTCREMLDDEALQHFMRGCCKEIVSVMRARGVPIVDEEDPYRPVVGSQRALGKNRPSMWQDLARGFPTEVDALNGAVVKEAERLGLEAPLNWGLVRFIKSREEQVLRRRRRAAQTIAQAKESQPTAQTAAQPMRKDRLGGMPDGRVPLECAPKLKELMHSHYLDLQAATQDPARRVVWCSGLGPVELLRALGLTPYFPENHAALIGASRQGSTFIRRALAAGFSPNANSAMTSDIGAFLAHESPLVSVHDIAGPPRPDALVYSTNYSDTLRHWFEWYSSAFDAPVLGLHPPPILGEVEQLDVDGAVQQILRAVRGLEERFSLRLDIDRLGEVVGLSSRAATLYAMCLDLSNQVPSPWTYFDMLVHLAPMVLLRGTPQAVEYYRILLAELESRVNQGQAAVPGERFRFYWEGPPIWCGLRSLSTLFLNRGVAVVGSTYSRIFALQGLDAKNPIESMARTYLGIFPNRSNGTKAAILTAELQRLGVDAVVYHDGRTSQKHSSVRYGLQHRVQQTTGLPFLVLEADTHDTRVFSMEQLELQLEDFIELTALHAAREARAGAEPEGATGSATPKGT
ncbi:MAG: 2-dehydropantoate 2-reductase [Polyangia bacterium]|jgi:2-dehydropantoate 2-reductase|nr:2-dehydropantoate 2-reductase [Polyangia bacterium]